MREYIFVSPNHFSTADSTNTIKRCCTLQYIATHFNYSSKVDSANTLQHASTHCDTLQYTAALFQNSSKVDSTYTLQQTAKHCNKLQLLIKSRQHDGSSKIPPPIFPITVRFCIPTTPRPSPING